MTAGIIARVPPAFSSSNSKILNDSIDSENPDQTPRETVLVTVPVRNYA